MSIFERILMSYSGRTTPLTSIEAAELLAQIEADKAMVDVVCAPEIVRYVNGSKVRPLGLTKGEDAVTDNGANKGPHTLWAYLHGF